MSFLWECEERNPLQTNFTRPSPKQSSDKKKKAQKSFTYYLFLRTIKRISLFISKLKCVNASMTVEAAVVLPLFLVFFLSLGTAIEMLRLHGNLEFALCDVGKRMAVYGYALTASEQGKGKPKAEGENEWLAELKDLAFSFTYVKSEIVDYLSREYLEASPICEGVDGLQFVESEIFGAGDCLEIIVTYRVSPFGGIAGVRGFRMANRYYAHLWNGYCIPKTEGADMVYITEYGQVYHEDEMCSHLFLTVRGVSLAEACESRNSSGAKYTLCEYCEKTNVNGLVYITEDGDKIHYRRDCTGLKRTVYSIPREDAVKYAPCARCAKK